MLITPSRSNMTPYINHHGLADRRCTIQTRANISNKAESPAFRHRPKPVNQFPSFSIILTHAQEDRPARHHSKYPGGAHASPRPFYFRSRSLSQVIHIHTRGGQLSSQTTPSAATCCRFVQGQSPTDVPKANTAAKQYAQQPCARLNRPLGCKAAQHECTGTGVASTIMAQKFRGGVSGWCGHELGVQAHQ